MNFSQAQTLPLLWQPELVSERIVTVAIEGVAFDGDEYLELTNDDGATVYAPWHWVDLDGNSDPTNTAMGERNYPVAFVRDTIPKITAVFKTPGLTTEPIKIRAHGSDGIEIPATTATIQNGYTLLPWTPSTTELPETIKYPQSGTTEAPLP